MAKVKKGAASDTAAPSAEKRSAGRPEKSLTDAQRAEVETLAARLQRGQPPSTQEYRLMLAFLFGFIAGVIAGPTFLARVWPRLRAWWNDINPP